jgi:branched-chain amino acid transport system permease protein
MRTQIARARGPRSGGGNATAAAQSRDPARPVDRGPAVAALLLVAAGLVFVFSAPSNAFLLGLLVIWATYSLAVLGLDISVGWLREVSVGQAGAMAVGGYAGVKCLGLGPWGLLLALACAALGGLAYGALCGLLASRVHGFALATFTLVIGQAVVIIFQEVGALGAISGIVVSPPVIFGTVLSLTDIAALSLVLLALGVVASRRLRYATFGRRLVAVGTNPRTAASFGINLFLARLKGFMLAGLFAGLAGFVLVLSLDYFSADQFSIDLGIQFLAMLIIGGRLSLVGPLIGSALFVVGQQYIPSGVGIPGMTFGLLALLAIWLLPDGLVGVGGVARGIKLRRTSPPREASR